MSRRDQIAERLARGEPVVASSLAVEFHMSEDAIRRDLRALATEGKCRRVYGGALPISPASTDLATRLEEDPHRKHMLARAAARLIGRGDVLFLDSGSTNQALAHELPENLDLTIVTNSIPVAAALFNRAGTRLIMIGGAVDGAVGACVDAEAVAALQRFHIDKCFLGACAISVDRGAAGFDAADAVFKRALLSISRDLIVMVMAEKLETQAPHIVASLAQLDHIIVEHGTPRDLVNRLEQAGPAVITADRPSGT